MAARELQIQEADNYFRHPRNLQQDELARVIRVLEYERTDATGYVLGSNKKSTDDEFDREGSRVRLVQVPPVIIHFFGEEGRREAVMKMNCILDALTPRDRARPEVAVFERFVRSYTAEDTRYDGDYHARLDRDRRIRENPIHGTIRAEAAQDDIGLVTLQDAFRDILSPRAPESHKESTVIVYYQSQEAVRETLDEFRKQTADSGEIFPGVPFGSVICLRYTEQGLEFDDRLSVNRSVRLGTDDARKLTERVHRALQNDRPTKSFVTDLYVSIMNQLEDQ